MPATELTLRLPNLHAGQQRIRDSKARFKVAAIGRRFGKTHFGVDEAAEVLLDGGKVGWFSPTYKLLGGKGGVWPYAKKLLRPIIRDLSEQDHAFGTVTGGSAEFWSLDNGGADKARSREYHFIVIDEAAMIADLLDQWDNAIRAFLTTFRGSALFLSTPRGFNDFHTLYKRGDDPEYPEWASFHAPSRESPFFPAEEWADLLRAVERGELPAATFAQEYEAIFTAPEGLVYGLDRDGIAFYEPSRNIRPAPVRWEECKWRIASIDPGGRDPTGLLAGGVTPDDRHHVYFAERREGMVSVFDYNEWLWDLVHAAGRRDQDAIDAVMVGETGGESMTETLRRMGWRAFKAAVSPGDKGRGIQHVRGLLKSGRQTIGPAFRQAFDEEMYSYKFDERKPGQSGDNTWATVIDASVPTHGELVDTLRYFGVGVLDGYPVAVQVGTYRAVGGRGTVRRAG